MAYQTGTATDGTDLLDKLRLFLSANGWTINRWSANPNGGGNQLCVQSPSVGDPSYFNFADAEEENSSGFYVNSIQLTEASYLNTGICLNGSDGYDAGALWDEQPGGPRGSSGGRSPNFPRHTYCPFDAFGIGPFPSYHFYLSTDAETCFVVTEVATGVYYHFGFGKLDTFNSLTSPQGRFFFGSSGDPVFFNTTNWWLTRPVDDSSRALEIMPGRVSEYSSTGSKGGCFVRIAEGGFDAWAQTCRGSASPSYSARSLQGVGQSKIIAELAPDPLNEVGVLVPSTLGLYIGSTLVQPIGTIPGLRYMRMDSFLPGDEFSLGSDVWNVYPWLQQGGWSLQRGMAFLKEV